MIGLAVYAVMFAALEWLLPENFTQQALNNSGSSSSSSSSSVSSKKTNAEIRAELSKVAKKFAHAKNNRDVNLKNAKNLNEYQQVVLATGVSGTKGDGGAGRCRDIGKACSAYVATVVRTVITDDTGNKFPPYTSNIPKYVKKVNKKHPGTWKTVSVKNMQPGDIVYEYDGKLGNPGHVMIFVKNSKGKTVVAHANVGTTNSATTCSGGAFWPKVTSFTSVPLYHQHAVVYRYMGGAK